MTHNKTKLTALLLGVTAFAASAALAGSPETMMADANSDGQVSYAEFSAQRDLNFSIADENSDGKISKTEREAQKLVRKQMRADKRFNRLDANDDGTISRSEFDAAGEQRAARKQERRQKMNGGQGGKRGGRMAGRNNPDTNGDGFIDRAEFDAKSKTKFASMDADNNGFITQEEHKTGKRQMKQGRRGGHGH